MPNKHDIGIIGLAVMGANLARNFASRGSSTAVFNRSEERTDELLALHGNEHLVGYYDIKDFVKSLARPRKVMIMVKAGPAVDTVIASILPHLQKGDIIIDGGNTYYRDTERRHDELEKKGIHYVGCGVSGGEEGALHGPSLMPGGSKESWNAVKPVLEPIAAKDFGGKPCVTHVGLGAAGHYVKMVHNGIEYAIMQMIAETYDILRRSQGMSASQIGDVFAKWNRGKLGSFLFETAEAVLAKEDDKTDGMLIDNILDVAGAKGTGKWTSQDALDRGVPVPSIAEAVFARGASGKKKLRQALGDSWQPVKKKMGKSDDVVKLLGEALYAAIYSAYAQGYDLIQTASKEEGWKVNVAEVSRIWEGGCIIRAKLLKTIHQEYVQKGARNKHLFELPGVAKSVRSSSNKLRQLVSQAALTGTPVPAFASALSYIDAMHQPHGPANMIQGLRDNFGAHTYKRSDRNGTFHTNWE